MRIGRCLAVGAIALGGLSAAWAQFTGPAPLAWRWAHPTAVSPQGAPLVSGDTVYMAVGNRVFGLDKNTGNQKWRFPLVEPITGYFRSGPLLAEGTVVAAADNKFVYGIDANTGNSKWQYVSQVPIVGQPILAGNVVVIHLNDNSILGIRADNGKPEWKDEQGNPTPYRVFAGIGGGLAAHGSTIMFLTQDGELVAISATTRRQLWKAKFGSVTPGSVPIVMGDTAFVNSGTWIVAVNAITGGGRWQQNVGDMLDQSPAVSPEGVMTVSMDGKAFLFDTGTGRPKIKQPIDLTTPLSARPAAVDKLFLAPTTNGALNVINPADGSVVWTYFVSPLNRGATSASTGGSQPGGRPGGPPGGLGGPGGAGGALGGAGGIGGGGQSSSGATPIAVPASGPAVVSGNTLFVPIADGSLLAFDKVQGVDLTGPEVKMAWPNPGDQVSGQTLELIFKIQDEASGVKASSVKVTIDGQDYESQFGRDGFAIVKISGFSKNKPLADGRKAIKVTASDWIGNARTEEFGLTIDNTLAPAVRPGAATNNNNRPGGGPGGRGGIGG